VLAEYVTGVINLADKPARTLTTRNDWTFRGGCPGGGVAPDGSRPTIDAFAGVHNPQLPHYWTYYPSPHASGKNAMPKVRRRQQLLHINPPWGMIPRILAKLPDDIARAVIVAPRWQSTLWWPTLGSMRLDPPYIISGSLYKDRDGQLAPAPRWLTQVCLLGGTRVGGTTKNTNHIV